MAAKESKRVLETFVCDPDFCPGCGSILPLPGQEDVVSCRLCSFQKDTAEFENVEIHSRKVFNIVKEKTAEGIKADYGGPKADRKCSKCGHDGMTYHTQQTRSADEGQTVFFSCPNCKSQEIEYS